MLIAGGVWFVRRHPLAKASAQTTSKTQETVARPIDSAALASRLGAIISQNPDLDISISLTDLQTGARYHYGETASYDAASMIKLITAADFLHHVENGDMSLDAEYGDDTGQNQLQKMIVDSDNTAWSDLENAVTLDDQQSYAASIGLSSYQVDSNVISSNDINLLLEKLCDHRLLDASNTNLLLGYMKQANYRDYIVAAIPADIEVYHKVGLLDDRLLDAAIIKQGNRSYILSIFTKAEDGSYDFSRGSTLFGDITRVTLQAFL